jgi:hypothetical protein
MIGLSGLMISAFEKSGGRRLRRAAVVLLLGVLEVACNENYRPIVQPVLPPPPNPAAIHFVFALSSNGPLDPGSGSALMFRRHGAVQYGRGSGLRSLESERNQVLWPIWRRYRFGK